MYSALPVPQISWTPRSMKYALCWFPLVGAVCALLSLAGFRICSLLQFPDFLRAALLTAIPVLVTGGIHLDGFLDAEDAIHSCTDRDKKLQIMKDPHLGGFAVIYGMVFILLFSGAAGAVTEETIPLYACGFVCSRILSAISVVRFPKAKKDGMLRTFSDAAGRRVLAVLLVEFAGLSVLEILLWGWSAVMVLAAGAAVFLYYRLFSVRVFGGTTGDLAGYFLCQCELWMLVVLVVGQRVFREVLCWF